MQSICCSWQNNVSCTCFNFYISFCQFIAGPHAVVRLSHLHSHSFLQPNKGAHFLKCWFQIFNQMFYQIFNQIQSNVTTPAKWVFSRGLPRLKHCHADFPTRADQSQLSLGRRQRWRLAALSIPSLCVTPPAPAGGNAHNLHAAR